MVGNIHHIHSMHTQHVSRHIQLMCLCIWVALFSVLQIPSAHANSKYAGLVVDADTGKVLYQDSAGRHRYPASLTKVMTLYLTFDAIESGKLQLNQRIYVSKRAAAQPPSKLGLTAGQTIKVKDAINALIVKSANDVAVVLAEAIAGSEWQFAKLMTAKARELGMRYTSFRNASGLHNRRQKTTAYDMARMASALYNNHRKYYHMFNKTKFYYRGELIQGHNRVTRNYPGADGLKTGYTRASGYNLITSAQRGDMRIIGVVMGGKSSRSRDTHMRKILDRSFRKLASINRTYTRTAKHTTPMPTLKPSTQLSVAVLNDNRKLPRKPEFTNAAFEPAKHIQVVSKPARKIASTSRHFIPMPNVSPLRVYQLSATESSLEGIEEGGDR